MSIKKFITGLFYSWGVFTRFIVNLFVNFVKGYMNEDNIKASDKLKVKRRGKK